MLYRSRQFRFDWKLTLLVVLFLPVTLKLGFWQLDREQEKRQIMALYDIRQGAEPVPLEELDTGDDLQYIPVLFEGTVLVDRIFLLDNRIYQGTVGYEVIQPVVTPNGEIVFLNRGWIAQGLYRDQLPDISALAKTRLYRGTVHVPVGKPVVLSGDLMSSGWPKVIQVEDVGEMARVAGITGKLFPYSVRIEDGVAGALTRYWPVINLGPDMHRGYAVQWFAMSLMLVLIFIYYSTRGKSSEDDQHENTR